MFNSKIRAGSWGKLERKGAFCRRGELGQERWAKKRPVGSKPPFHSPTLERPQRGRVTSSELPSSSGLQPIGDAQITAHPRGFLGHLCSSTLCHTLS